MEKPELLRRFEAILDEAGRTGMWGTVEVELQRGEPVLLRTIKTEKIEQRGEQSRATKKSYR
jgi:hypothetical protein